MNEIADILNDCLERLAGGDSIEACLAAFPGHAAELEPLLRTAGAILRLSQVVPDPARKAAAKRYFLEAARQEDSRPRFVRFPLRWRPIAASLAAVLLISTAMAGSMVASANSTPEDPLYAVKRAAERVQLLLSRDDDETVLHMELADKRLSELEIIADRQGTIRASLLTEAMHETGEAIAGLERSSAKEKLGEQLLGLSSRQQEVINRVAAKAPEEAKEGLSKALEQSKKGHQVASTAVARNRNDDRRGDDGDEQHSVAPSATSTARQSSPTPGAKLPTATATPIASTSTPAGPTNTAQATSRGGESEKSDREKTPTTRLSATPRADDGRRESTGTSTPQPTPSRTPRPTEARRPAEPTATTGKTSIPTITAVKTVTASATAGKTGVPTATPASKESDDEDDD